MKAVVLGLLAALAAAPVAYADAADDGDAGLAAYNAGDYAQAVALFSRALASGQLHGDDKELATASRGRAYLKAGNVSLAIVDLDRARRMKPSDTDAQNDLVTALSTKLPADQIPGLPKASFWSQLGAAAVQAVADGITQSLQENSQ